MVMEGVDRSMDLSYLERRSERRLIKRLNWGKMLSIRNEFLSECLITNQTSMGARLRIARHVDIPRVFLLFDDNTRGIFEGETIWRTGRDLGCKITGKPHEAHADLVRRMCSRYYGL